MFAVTRLDNEKVAYLFFKIFIKQTKIVHLYSKRSSFINHSAVFAILFIAKFSDFTTQQHGRRSLAGVCRQLSARPPNIKGVSFLVRFPILWRNTCAFCSVLNFKIAECLHNAIVNINIEIDKLIFIFRYY